MSSIAPLTPLPSLRISTHHIPSHSLLPNCPAPSHPLYIYHNAYPPTTSPSALESHLSAISVFYCGRVRLCFGGEGNPGRVEMVVKAGDAIVIPAGVGHRLWEDLEGGFQMVGAYPKGRDWDMCYGKEGEGEGEKAKAVKDVEWFKRDPLYWDEGFVVWKYPKRGISVQ
ncbi:uncharacterized protein BDR25DRAFT_324203 [Lindgomyces ingoldianus]|uniref:Uncharacterized protein n=1 Tax=Lindgomyces ingoldianus TaxID=673940 RepID=A0ACB6R344_9PLEO|nr:uncharacterized protein BDR25DRAFT_324203 [Lindgomyces ingoldianus]KAF2472932.1 hypothetical protein BDR25DRAFT_324203 [Lindgomyces ingoldianus]